MGKAVVSGAFNEINSRMFRFLQEASTEGLVDIVSKNGNLLLNILQKPDGTIDDETKYLPDELAGWFAINGEAIHGTRPWRLYGEGDSSVTIEGFKEDKVAWNSSDYRFVQKGNTLYAFMLGAPENRVAVVKSLTESEKVMGVKLLGGSIDFPVREWDGPRPGNNDCAPIMMGYLAPGGEVSTISS